MTRRDVRRNQLMGSARPRLEALEARDTPALIGGLDPSFGTAGRTTVAGLAFAAAAHQADGKVVAVGNTAGDLLVARFNPDGSLDASFNATGKRTLDFGGQDNGSGVAVQTDGRIVVVGFNTPSGNAVVARFNPDGMPDTSFAGTGSRLVDLGGPVDRFSAVVVQPDGKLVASGFNGGGNFVVARFNGGDGSNDLAFGGTGVVTQDVGGIDFASALALQPDGKIVVAGGNGADFAVARFTSGGAIDAGTFNPAGIIPGTRQIDIAGGIDFASGVAVQPDGKIVLGGNTPSDFAAARVNADGSLDLSFNGTGKQTVDVGGANDAATALALQPDGRILLIGTSGTLPATDIAVVRLTPTGVLDTGFDADGRATANSGATEQISAGLLTPQGRIVVVGTEGGNGFVARLIGSVEKGTRLAAGGSIDAAARVFVPTAAGQFGTPAAATLSPFGALGVNVRVATADVDGDGFADTILVTGPGTPTRFAVVSGRDNTTLLVPPTAPFVGSEGFAGGGFVAAADFDNDGRAQFVFTPDQGGGPRVAIYSLVGTTATVRANFFGIDDAGFRGGARAAAGDVNGDAVADLAVAAGFQGGPRVAVFDGKTVFGATRTKLVNDFFAFPDVLRNGVFVAIGDVDGDGFGDLIIGAGPGGGPRVLTLSGQTLATKGAAAAIDGRLSNFFVAGADSDRGGVRVAAVDADGDGRADVAVATGEGRPSRVRVYLGKNTTAGEPTQFQDIDPFNATLAGGVFVG